MDVYIRMFKEWHYVNYAIRTIFPGMDPLTFSYWNASINHVAVFYLKIWNIEYLDKLHVLNFKALDIMRHHLDML